MRPGTHAQPVQKLILLGTIELGLLPLRLLARVAGGLMLAVAAIGIPAWLIQLAISLAGGGNGDGPLPAWAMLLTLAGAVPTGLLAMRLASTPGPLHRTQPRPHHTAEDPDQAGSWQQADQFDDSEPAEPATSATDPLAWAYQTLELDPTATPAEIKAAYRRLAHIYHPDHNPGFSHEAAARFATITGAYEAILASTTPPA